MAMVEEGRSGPSSKAIPPLRVGRGRQRSLWSVRWRPRHRRAWGGKKGLEGSGFFRFSAGDVVGFRQKRESFRLLFLRLLLCLLHESRLGPVRGHRRERPPHRRRGGRERRGDRGGIRPCSAVTTPIPLQRRTMGKGGRRTRWCDTVGFPPPLCRESRSPTPTWSSAHIPSTLWRHRRLIGQGFNRPPRSVHRPTTQTVGMLGIR